ncbi:uncharacterized protein LOC133812760 [Humulus lupulus]|uniref:uncharacterized protein LOC133812760 n=1 Tax=Humulus lupulus TaxID=3486 RepID=UPI002B4123D0|nr:uncharacterized protein LOC133812760 [Humulus lupulus]
MEAKLLNSLTRAPPLPTTLSLPNHRLFSHLTRRTLKFSPIHASSSDDTSPASDRAPSQSSQITPPPETVEVRFRRRSSRRQLKKLREEGGDEERFGKAATKTKPAPPVKKWEEMSFAEKAWELYVGEKGALFWLNKFAYASIFIVIGGWILFRFVGPSLNLYQLDSAPLSPGNLFKGS